jgi:hypothetical protein
MAWTKAKTSVVAGAALILAAGTTTVIVKNSNHHSQMNLQGTPAEKASSQQESASTINQSQWTPDKIASFQRESSNSINQVKFSALTCFLFAQNHQHRWPTNFAQIKNQPPGMLVSDSKWEFVSGGNKDKFTNPHQTILFREKESRQSPDGKFVKIYALADGSVQELISTDDDFSTLEKQNGFLVQQVKN